MSWEQLLEIIKDKVSRRNALRARILRDENITLKFNEQGIGGSKMTAQKVKEAQKEILQIKDPTLKGVRILRNTLNELYKGAHESGIETGRQDILDNIYDYIPEPDGLEL